MEGFAVTRSRRAQPIMMVRAQWQEPVAAGHVTSTVRKGREMDAGAQLAFPFVFILEPPTRGMALSTFRVCLQTQLPRFRTSLTDTPRGLSRG